MLVHERKVHNSQIADPDRLRSLLPVFAADPIVVGTVEAVGINIDVNKVNRAFDVRGSIPSTASTVDVGVVGDTGGVRRVAVNP